MKTTISNSALSITGVFPPSIGQLDAMEHFNLFNTGITNWLPDTVGNWSKLKQLRIYGNLAMPPVPFPTFIHSSFPSLSDLRIFRNQITGTIPPELGNLKSLVFVRLLGNQISGTLPQSITALPALQELDVSENGISGTIPKMIGDLNALTILRLGDNFFRYVWLSLSLSFSFLPSSLFLSLFALTNTATLIFL
jgi:Leucine-rich repeat (LRR) protein